MTCSWRIGIGLILLFPALVFGQNVRTVQHDSIEVEPLESDSTASETIEFWGLTASEWQRQKIERERYEGLLSPQITPLEVLGITADDPQERARYARLFAERQHQLLLRIQDFEEDYQQAFQKLAQSTQVAELRLVVEVGCLQGSCSIPLARALSRVEQGENLHIYVQGAGTDDQIRRWAAHHSIPVQRVRAGQITLNHATETMQLGLSEQ